MKHLSEVKEYNGFREGQQLRERIGQTNRYRQILCKGIFQDDSGKMFAGFQYIDPKATRQNKRVTVSGKSPFWFEAI